jgi:hypothetical protein
LNAELDSGAKYLASLPPSRRAKFLAELAHDLTIAGRAVFHSDEPLETRAADLYVLNEIQHRVVSYVSHALGDDEDTSWLVPVLAFIFEQENPRVRRHAIYAWTGVCKRWQAVA